MLRPCKTVPQAVVSPNHKAILLLLRNCNFDTVMTCNCNYLICDPSERVVQRPKGIMALGLGTAAVQESGAEYCVTPCNLEEL